MHAALVFILFLSWSQDIDGKETNHVTGLRNHVLSFEYDERSIVDIWNNIKDKARQTWESIKAVANNAKKKLLDLVQKVKKRARDLAVEFEERLKKIKDRINDMIQDVMNTGEIVKKCLQERKQAIDEILKNILVDVINCLSTSVTLLDTLTSAPHEYIPNKTEYLKKIEDQLSACLVKRETNDVEDCFHAIKMSIYENMETTEEDILQNHINTRSATDDILDRIITCTSDGMIKASSAIANETILIIECVSQGQLESN